MLNSHIRIAAVLAAAVASSMVSAQSKLYVSGTLGATNTSGNYSGQVQSAGAPQPGFRFVSAGKDGGSDVGGRLAIGYRFTEGIAVELGYASFGKQDVGYQFEKTTGLIPPQRFVTSVGRFKLDGATLDVVGTLPINASFSANARVGVIAANLRYKEFQTFLNQGTTEFSKTANETRLHWGVGATYQMNKTLGLTLDYTQAQSVGKSFAWTEDRNGRLSYGMFAAGVRYSF
jgi:OmpA-like transmembrane domain